MLPELAYGANLKFAARNSMWVRVPHIPLIIKIYELR